MVSHFWKENQIMNRKRGYVFSLLLACVATLSAQYYTPEDDIYFTPSDKNPVVEKRENERVVQQAVVVADDYGDSSYNTTYNERDVDEYNRRYYFDDTASYVDSLYENQEEPEMTYYMESGDEGYYIDDFEGSAMDFEYAERIRRFHNPKFTIHISNPAYNDIYFMSGTGDWNIYVDGSYAWVTPTWTNPYYWNYMWSPYSYSSFSWGWGYGYGYGYYGWYGNHYRPWYYGNYHRPPHYNNKPHYATSYRKSTTGRNTVSTRNTVGTRSTTSSSSTRSTGTSSSTSSSSRTRVSSSTPSSSSSSSGVSSSSTSSRTRSSSTSTSASSSSSSTRSSSSSSYTPSSSSSSRSSGTSSSSYRSSGTSSSSSRSSGGSSSGRR